MKKWGKIFLAIMLCLSLSACGRTVEGDLIGQWKYDTGMAVWDFIFEEDGYVRFTSGRHWIEGTYTIDQKHQNIEVAWIDEYGDHTWDFSYELKSDGIELIHALGWYFEKNENYDKASEKNTFERKEMMSEEVLEQVETLIAEGDAEWFALFRLGYQYPDVTFTDFEITSSERQGYYRYSVYGKVYSKDKFNELYEDKVEVAYEAHKTEDSDGEPGEGYSIQRYLYKYDENNNIIP